MRWVNKHIMMLQEEAGGGEVNGGGGAVTGDEGTEVVAGADVGEVTGGEGEKLFADKYKTQEELEKGYKELNASFSSKDEAHKAELAKFKSPEEYVPGEGWTNEDPMANRMMAVLQDIGKTHNLPQDMYEDIFNGISEMQSRVQEDTLAETVKSIPNFDNRSAAMQDTALRFLRPDQAKGIDALMQSKESFEAMEVIMGQLRGASLPGNPSPAQDMSDTDLRSAIRQLNPSDTAERARLMNILNTRGGGEGKLI